VTAYHTPPEREHKLKQEKILLATLNPTPFMGMCTFNIYYTNRNA